MKNYNEEYEKFVQEQCKMKKDLNPSWIGWFYLYLAYKIEKK